MTVNIPEQDRDATCRIVASTEVQHASIVPLETVNIAYQDGSLTTVAMIL